MGANQGEVGPADERGTQSLSWDDLVAASGHFADRLASLKAASPQSFEWYPYSIMGNVTHLRNLCGGSYLWDDLVGAGRVADIGAADGDLSFFIEDELGVATDVIDWPATNANGMKAVAALRDMLDSEVRVHEVDLDSQFTLPEGRYDLVLFLGILYHLKNPFYALERLAERTRWCVLSTRIFETTVDRAHHVSGLPLAYLVGSTETNEDPTNFWMFTEAGLLRLAERTGWKVERFMKVGCMVDADPSSPDRDQRAFCLLRSEQAD